MSRLAPARRVALSLVSTQRRRSGRVRDIARDDAALARLDEPDRALAFRLALGATGTSAVLDALIDERLKRPSALEPRVRDALRLATYELCYLNTPAAVAASQGVELVRSVTPRAAGLANAVLRRIATETRPRVEAARAHVREGSADAAELSLAAGLPSWLVERVTSDRGLAFASALCTAQLEPPPVFVAAHGLRHDAAELEALLAEAGMGPRALPGLPGSFELAAPGSLARTDLVTRVDLVVADVAAQVVCRLAAPSHACDLLEVGQGRGTKSVLLATAVGAVHPTHIVAVDAVASKVRASRRRMEAAGLQQVVSCHELDACTLDGPDLPKGLDRQFGVVLVDAPCSGTGTLRRHPEIATSLAADDVAVLADLQLRMLSAAASRVAPDGLLLYATCSVLRTEDEAVVAAFLTSEAGRAFEAVPVSEVPACARDAALRARVVRAETSEGYLLTTPAPGGEDGHFCACLRRRG